MFDWFKGKPAHPQLELRDTLFGDILLPQYTVSAGSMNSEPWASFMQAKQSIDSEDRQGATKILLSILEMPGLESRHYLQAWSFLRTLGVNPPNEKDKEILGVVIEIGFGGGLDLVAAYADHHARYYNYSGAGVVWERPDDSLDPVIDNLLKVGGATIKAIGPWKDIRPPAPPKNHPRINLLSPSGLHFGQGLLDDLSKDQLGGPVLAAAFHLMQELIRKSEEMKKLNQVTN
jgi:hypothetical protein